MLSNIHLKLAYSFFLGSREKATTKKGQFNIYQQPPILPETVENI